MSKTELVIFLNTAFSSIFPFLLMEASFSSLTGSEIQYLTMNSEEEESMSCLKCLPVECVNTVAPRQVHLRTDISRY